MEYHRFSKSSLKKLERLDPDMRRVVKLALKYSKHDFGVSETLRTIEKQKEYVASGASQTMKSRHLENEYGYSEAVDIYAYVDGKANYEAKYMRKIAAAMFKAAFELNVAIEWGGMWQSFFDSPHYQKAGGF